MPESEKVAYVAANEAFREAQQSRMALNQAVDHAEISVRNVEMSPNSSLVLISVAKGFLATLNVALNEAVEVEEEAAKRAKRRYEALHAERGWGTSLEDLEELRISE